MNARDTKQTRKWLEGLAAGLGPAIAYMGVLAVLLYRVAVAASGGGLA